MFRWLRWSEMSLCWGKLAYLASLILSQFWALRSAAWPRSCSAVMYGRLIQYSFSASRSRCFSILRFICQVILRGRRYFPIHCFPGMPFLNRARVRNMVEDYLWKRQSKKKNTAQWNSKKSYMTIISPHTLHSATVTIIATDIIPEIWQLNNQ